MVSIQAEAVWRGALNHHALPPPMKIKGLQRKVILYWLGLHLPHLQVPRVSLAVDILYFGNTGLRECPQTSLHTPAPVEMHSVPLLDTHNLSQHLNGSESCSENLSFINAAFSNLLVLRTFLQRNIS